jgi:predicted RNA-binding Zn-ribbon protein involved in translation (DUF1610 family)
VKIGIVKLSEAAKANTLSATDLLYGVKTKNGKRVNFRYTKADRIVCPQCGSTAWLRTKLWEKNAVGVYLCEKCGFAEQKN